MNSSDKKKKKKKIIYRYFIYYISIYRYFENAVKFFNGLFRNNYPQLNKKHDKVRKNST